MPSIFICYAHQDNKSSDPSRRWLERLQQHLASLELEGQIEIWSDEQIELGEDWHDRIQAALKQVKAAVLLVSPVFLASKYIRNSELPVLLKQAKEVGVAILPVILSPCRWQETIFKYPHPQEGPEELSLSAIQVPTIKPLNSLSESEQDDVLYRLTERIAKIVNPQSPKLRESPEEAKSNQENNSPVSHKLSSLQEKYRQQLMRQLEAAYQKLGRVDGAERVRVQQEVEELESEIKKIE